MSWEGLGTGPGLQRASSGNPQKVLTYTLGMMENSDDLMPAAQPTDVPSPAKDSSLEASAESSVPSGPPLRPVPSKMSRLWREWVRPFLIILAIVGSFRSAFADWNDVPTGSMIPTIVEGDRIFVNKVAYSLRVPFTKLHVTRWDSPDRGDIVVFFSPDENKRLVKRVVGLPGDRIELRQNHLIVNGELVEYEPLPSAGVDVSSSRRMHHARFEKEFLGDVEHAITLFPFQSPDSSFGAIEVPEGHYYVMGDNRDNSRDSRFFGFVDQNLIVGRAVAVAFSLDRTQGFKPRWKRSFKKLN